MLIICHGLRRHQIITRLNTSGDYMLDSVLHHYYITSEGISFGRTFMETIPIPSSTNHHLEVLLSVYLA